MKISSNLISDLREITLIPGKFHSLSECSKSVKEIPWSYLINFLSKNFYSDTHFMLKIIPKREIILRDSNSTEYKLLKDTHEVWEDDVCIQQRAFVYLSIENPLINLRIVHSKLHGYNFEWVKRKVFHNFMFINYDFIYLEFSQSFLNVIDGLKKKN